MHFTKKTVTDEMSHADESYTETNEQYYQQI
jgi:hypothetical protein